MKEYSIILIIIYFGKWPKWYKLFLESCKRNGDIDFLIFTDQDITVDNSKTIRIIKFSLAGFNSVASRKLNMQIEIDDPYKICDLRPAFGNIFEDYIQSYDFWGHTDVDLIFGKITRFITSHLLDNYEVITARKEYLVGHFTLYRNSRKVNFLYRLSECYENIFLSKHYSGFDECNFLWWKLIAGRDILSMPIGNPSMTHLIKKLVFHNRIKALFTPLVMEQDHDSDPFDKVLLWKEGNLTDVETKKDILYFHFHYLKQKKDFYCPLWGFAPNAFQISKNGFSDYN